MIEDNDEHIRSASFLKRMVREPLIHFVLLGAMIYMAYGFYGSQDETTGGKTLTVSAGEVSWMTQSWEKRWGRPPTEDEREGFINAYIREGILYQEALDMGLDKDDVIIRRRLAQKLEFLTQDLASMIEPVDGELLAYFDANIDEYRDPDLISFTHIFFDPDKREDATLPDAEEAVNTFRDKAPTEINVRDYGDAFMLQSHYPEYTQLDVMKAFGSGFTDKLFTLSEGEWHSPVLSGFGVHVVYVHEIREAPEPTFEAVKSFVTQDWMDAKREEVNEQFYASLRDRYEVIVEEDGDAEMIVEARNE